MLYNGEEVGDGDGARGRRRRRPARGHAPDGARHPERDRGDRGRRARLDVLPRRRDVHGQDRGRPRRRATRSTSRGRPPRTSTRVAEAKGMDVRDLTVVVLERDRHEALIDELRASGARVRLIRDGDVSPSIAAAQPFTGIDMLMGVGGTPEGVISAAAIKCLGGALQARLWPRSARGAPDARRARATTSTRCSPTTTSSSSDDCFVSATGVTGGMFLQGVRASAQGVETESIVMRSRSGTVRRISAYHPSEKVVELRRRADPRGRVGLGDGARGRGAQRGAQDLAGVHDPERVERLLDAAVERQQVGVLAARARRSCRARCRARPVQVPPRARASATRARGAPSSAASWSSSPGSSVTPTWKLPSPTCPRMPGAEAEPVDLRRAPGRPRRGAARAVRRCRSRRARVPGQSCFHE